MASQIPSYQPEFDPYSNDLWTRRHLAMQRFVQAARKVVIRLRCQARLKRLQLLASDISAGKTIQESLGEMYVVLYQVLELRTSTVHACSRVP